MRLGYTHRFAFRLELHPREHGIKNQRGLDGVRYVQLVDFFVTFRLLVQIVEHQLLVLIRDGHVRDGSGIVDHLFRDFRATLPLCLRP